MPACAEGEQLCQESSVELAVSQTTAKVAPYRRRTTSRLKPRTENGEPPRFLTQWDRKPIIWTYVLDDSGQRLPKTRTVTTCSSGVRSRASRVILFQSTSAECVSSCGSGPGCPSISISAMPQSGPTLWINDSCVPRKRKVTVQSACFA